MSGRWFLDNDQSFYFLEAEEPNNIECSSQLHRNDAVQERDGLRSTGIFPAHPKAYTQEKTGAFEVSPFQPHSMNLPHEVEDMSSQLAPSTKDLFCDESDYSGVYQSNHVGMNSSNSAISYYPVRTFSRPSNASSWQSHVEKRAVPSSSSLLSPRRNVKEQSERTIREDQITASFFRKAITIDRHFVRPISTMDLVMGYNTSLPRSRFDAYITALRQILRSSMNTCDGGDYLRRSVTAEGVLWVVRESWPAAEGYWNLTATFRGFLHAELWRNFPCECTYRQLPPEYRPTRAQLVIPHSPMIDWMPWPDLRDLAIMYQDQIDVDALFRMAIHNVVAHRKRIPNEPFYIANDSPVAATPTSTDDVTNNVSFRVWDMVCLEKSNGTNPLADPELATKPVLHSPSLKALVKAYDLEYDDFGTQKLDHNFFETFPFLYCETAASNWKLGHFQTLPQEDVGRPRPITRDAVLRLKSKIEDMVGMKIAI